MGTKKHNAIVLLVSITIAVGISFIRWKSRDPQHFESKVYEIRNGWGYGILVDNKVFIHQASIPGQKGENYFQQKKQAEQTAQLVISKLKKGQSPTVTAVEINQICASTAANGATGKYQ